MSKELLDRSPLQDLKEIRREIGLLSRADGYCVLNQAYKALPLLLENDYGIKVKTPLNRKYVRDTEGNLLEVNIFGTGEKEGQEIIIIGECKAQLSKNDVDTFLKKKVKRLEGVYPNNFLILVTHMTSGPDVEEYLKYSGIALYHSYRF
jgi:hypothetical protein